MRFFTPERYIQFNSSDDDEADRADEMWEATLQEYRRHLDGLRDHMPSPVRKLAEICLHDAELLGLEQAIEPFFPAPSERSGPFPTWSAVAIVSVEQDGTLISLLYALWDRLREYPPRPDWPFSKRRTHWLYDEIDVAPNSHGLFLHRILFSDGRVLEIPFLSVVIHRLPLPKRDANEESRQSA